MARRVDLREIFREPDVQGLVQIPDEVPEEPVTPAPAVRALGC